LGNTYLVPLRVVLGTFWAGAKGVIAVLTTLPHTEGTGPN